MPYQHWAPWAPQEPFPCAILEFGHLFLNTVGQDAQLAPCSAEGQQEKTCLAVAHKKVQFSGLRHDAVFHEVWTAVVCIG